MGRRKIDPINEELRDSRKVTAKLCFVQTIYYESMRCRNSTPEELMNIKVKLRLITRTLNNEDWEYPNYSETKDKDGNEVYRCHRCKVYMGNIDKEDGNIVGNCLYCRRINN